MLALVATALALSASSVMSLHRCCKYIITALSLHVWTASKTPSQGHLSAENPPRRNAHLLRTPDTRSHRRHILPVSPKNTGAFYFQGHKIAMTV